MNLNSLMFVMFWPVRAGEFSSVDGGVVRFFILRFSTMAPQGKFWDSTSCPSSRIYVDNIGNNVPRAWAIISRDYHYRPPRNKKLLAEHPELYRSRYLSLKGVSSLITKPIKQTVTSRHIHDYEFHHKLSRFSSFSRRARKIDVTSTNFSLRLCEHWLLFFTSENQQKHEKRRDLQKNRNSRVKTLWQHGSDKGTLQSERK